MQNISQDTVERNRNLGNRETKKKRKGEEEESDGRWGGAGEGRLRRATAFINTDLLMKGYKHSKEVFRKIASI